MRNTLPFARGALLLFLLLPLAVAAQPARATSERLAESGTVRAGAKAPQFGGWDLDGKKLHMLGKLLKDPQPLPLLISFGASWCTPCEESLPRLLALQKKHAGALRLVYIDIVEDKEPVRAFLEKHKWEGPVVLDKLGVIAKSYGVTSMPRTFLLDADGTVLAIFAAEGADLEEAIEAELKALGSNLAAFGAGLQQPARRLPKRRQQ